MANYKCAPCRDRRSLPLNASNKVLKFELRDRAIAALELKSIRISDEKVPDAPPGHYRAGGPLRCNDARTTREP